MREDFKKPLLGRTDRGPTNIDIDIKVSVTFLNESVDKRDILITYLYPCSERINVIKTSLERDISLTNLYPFQERIMVIETSL